MATLPYHPSVHFGHVTFPFMVPMGAVSATTHGGGRQDAASLAPATTSSSLFRPPLPPSPPPPLPRRRSRRRSGHGANAAAAAAANAVANAQMQAAASVCMSASTHGMPMLSSMAFFHSPTPGRSSRPASPSRMVLVTPGGQEVELVAGVVNPPPHMLVEPVH